MPTMLLAPDKETTIALIRRVEAAIGELRSIANSDHSVG